MSLLERMLGPNLGVRLGSDVDASSTPRTLINFRLLMGPLFLGCGLVAICSLCGTLAFADPLPGYRSGVMAATGVGATLAGLVIMRSEIWPTAWMIHAFAVTGTVTTTLTMYLSGPVMAPYSAPGYLLIAMTVATFLTRRAALVHLVLLGICLAGGLIALPPLRTPGAQWIIVVGFSVVAGFVVDQLVTRLADTVNAAQDARRVAEEARLEAERANELLEEASQHKSDFLAGMSHELRTPLNAVIGFADVLAGQHFGPLNERQGEYLDDIRDAGQHLLSLINDILDLSKVEAGLMEVRPEWFSLTDCVESALRLVRPRADAGGLSLATSFAAGATEAYGDPQRVRQVLVNLLSNAVKFTPAGGDITVTAEATSSDIVVSVRDTGIGISPDDLPQVFENFQQVGPQAHNHEGTGLGLALSRRFLDLHGGAIWATSEPGSGSVFTFRLPLPVRASVPGR